MKIIKDKKEKRTDYSQNECRAKTSNLRKCDSSREGVYSWMYFDKGDFLRCHTP